VSKRLFLLYASSVGVSANAKAMYTNIDTNTGINSIRLFLNDNRRKIPSNFPTDLFLEVLSIVMRNNIFSFSNTYWLQLTGTAMGTPTACSYATVAYGQRENSTILTTFHPYLLYYRRYIDDIFGIWVPPATGNNAVWEHFKTTLNNWGTLEWVIETPSNSTVFLDLNLKLEDGMIQTSTYQKSLNLYLYIPPNSAHPPSCLKGLISGELRRYWLQNDIDNFQTMLTKFIERLIDRGHRINDLIPLLKQAALAIDSNSTTKVTKNQSSTLFIHWRYHPHGLQRSDLRSCYEATLKQTLNYDKVTIAISRPKNLRDILSKTTLELPNNLDIDEIAQELKSSKELPANDK